MLGICSAASYFLKYKKANCNLGSPPNSWHCLKLQQFICTWKNSPYRQNCIAVLTSLQVNTQVQYAFCLKELNSCLQHYHYQVSTHAWQPLWNSEIFKSCTTVCTSVKKASNSVMARQVTKGVITLHQNRIYKKFQHLFWVWYWY